MKKKILAFGASSSRQSINKQLAGFAAKQIDNAEVILLDLNDFEMPVFSVDKESDRGIPKVAYQFKEHIKDSDGIIISFAEHNGNVAAAYKNIYDWVSRIESNFWYDKPMFLLATSPGGRGGKSVLKISSEGIRHRNKGTIVEFSLPSFNQNFDSEKGILDAELKNVFESQLELFVAAL
jgi:NAD(P)H-dependent FMN reductase